MLMYSLIVQFHSAYARYAALNRQFSTDIRTAQETNGNFSSA